LFETAGKTMSFSKKREIQAKSSVLAAGSYCTESAFAIRLYLLLSYFFHKEDAAQLLFPQGRFCTVTFSTRKILQ
jgi:hypothetical protein